MESREQSEKVGYVLLDLSGQVIAADETMRNWLLDQPVACLLPDLDLTSVQIQGVSRTRLCRAGLEPVLASVEYRRLFNGTAELLLLRGSICTDFAETPEYRDVVTGLPDRRALEMFRTRWQADADGKLPHALLFLDLDNFKYVNDSLGHTVGDKVLGVLAERWRKALRGGDLIVRYGGDEFIALLAGVRSADDVRPIVDRLQSMTISPIVIDGHTLQIDVAIGVALAADTSQPLEELIVAADQAMYAAKRKSL